MSLALAAAGEPPRSTVPAQDGGALARFQGVTQRFGQTRILDRLNLEIAPGEFLAVVGKSGCGKSTLLRLLARLDAPKEGRVSVAAAGRADEDAMTRIMFQEPRLLPWLRVGANVEVGLPPQVKGAERRERARAALASVGLAARADEWPAILSGGQKQRVALARALVSRPQLLLLDEPLGALDALTRIEMQRLIEKIWLEQGFTAVLVTHDVAEAAALADRIIVIESGGIGLDVAASAPRPRRRDLRESAELEGRILDHLLGP